MKVRIFVFILLLALILAGCSPAAATQAPQSAPAQATDYPVMPAQPTQPGYPGASVQGGYPGPGPAAAPALESREKVRAELVEQLADPQDAASTLLRIRLLTTEPVNGSPERLKALVGQVVEVSAPTQGLPALEVGDQFNAEIVYRGDENGGRYTAENIVK